MSSSKRPTVWQHPFVNLFKQFHIDDWKKSSKEGDVTSVMDKCIKCTVIKVQGSVPAANYIQFPRTSTQSLGLTGKYLYILFKPIPTKYFVVHIDTVSDDGLVARISFSNLFKDFKSTSTWLQFPFACLPGKGSVEHFASVGASQGFMGPAPLSQRWTMLVMDLQYILSMYLNRKYCHLKNIRLCANLLVKNCFTSDICYDPRLSVKQARLLGIKTVEKRYTPIPREMSFFLPKYKEWDNLYDIVCFPLAKSSPTSITPVLPFDSLQKNGNENTNVSIVKSKPGVLNSPRRKMKHDLHLNRKGELFSSATNSLSVLTSFTDQPRNPKLLVTNELPSVGVSRDKTTQSSCDPSASIVQASTGEIHVFAHSTKPNQNIVVHRHFKGSDKNKPNVTSTNLLTKQTVISNIDKPLAYDQSVLVGEKISLKRECTSLEPDPILKLKKIIGFGGGLNPHTDIKAYRHLAYWQPSSSMNDGNDVMVYAVHAVVVAMEPANGHQRFFVGHTENVTSIALNHNPGSPVILASAQGGSGGIVRLWRFQSQKCAAIIRSQHSSGMNVLAFSQTGAILFGAGRDNHGKTLVMVWNTSSTLRHGSVSVIAKAHTDVEISRIRVSPLEDTRMVTCGKDNLRFWRVISNQLRSCPVAVPNEHKIEDITDVSFAPLGLVSPKNLPQSDSGILSVYACTKAGYVIEVDFQRVVVQGVHRLYPSSSGNAKDDAQNNVISLNSIKFYSSYVATGSDDGMLRLWPLDLSSAFLEAEHESSVTDLDITPDGMKVLAVTSGATLGILDVYTRNYTTLMRSHTDVIHDSCMDGLRRMICTCSDDNSIRLWDIDGLHQLYDFATPNDTPTSVSCHPLLEIFAGGFKSGAIRIFHVATTSVLSEHTRVHKGSTVTSLIFTPSGERLISLCKKGTMAVFDASDINHVGAPLLRSLPKVAVVDQQNTLSVSPDGRKVAVVGPNEFAVTVFQTSSLDEILRIDFSTGFTLDPDILGQRLKMDLPHTVCFSSSAVNHIMVVTHSNRLIKLDSQSGNLVSITENIHRGSTTSLCSSDDGHHLVTAGDKLLKVWNYQMTKDITFQTFIGHSSSIGRLMFTPDHLTLISCGEDAIFFWDFLGCTTSPFNFVIDDQENKDKKETLQKSEKLNVFISLNKDEDSSEEDDSHPQSPEVLPQQEESTWVPPEILRTSDLDASPVSEFTVDEQMMRNLVKCNYTKENNKQHYKETIMTKECIKLKKKYDELNLDLDNDEQKIKHTLASNLKTLDLQSKALVASINSSVPVKIAWETKSTNLMKNTEVLPDNSVVGESDIHQSLVKSTPPTLVAIEPDIVTFQERPNVLSHFSSHLNNSKAAPRYYAAPQGQEGLQLQAVVGYNGNGRHNLSWNANTGRLAYSCGCLIVLENLATNNKMILKEHTEEVSCLAMQHDGQILASASGARGVNFSVICLWDVQSHKCKAKLKKHEFDIVALAYSRDDRFLVSVGDYRENLVIVWSAFDGICAPVLLTSTKSISPINHVTWDPFTANEFVTVGSDASILFWMLDEDGKEISLCEADVPENLRIDESREKVVDFTCCCYGEQHVLYIGSSTGVVSAWDTTNNCCFLHWKADSAEICVMQSSGNRLVVGGVSRQSRLWSLVGVKQLMYKDGGNPANFYMEDELSLHAEIISGVFDDALEMGIVGTTCGTIWYLDWNERSTIIMVSGHKGQINGITFDEGNYAATCSEEGTVRLWSLRTMDMAVQFQVINQSSKCVAFSHCAETTGSSLIKPKMLAAGYTDGTSRVFDIDKLILKLKLQPHATSVTAVQFSSDNDTLLSGSADGTVAVTSLSTGVTLRVLLDHKGAPINEIVVSLRKDHPGILTEFDSVPNDDLQASLMLICGSDRRVSVWSTEWRHDVCEMIDWLTFPAPCFAPNGFQQPNNCTKTADMLPPSVCVFHPTDPDKLLYCGYGLAKGVQIYSLTKKKVISSLPLANWASCMATSSGGGALMAVGTKSRLIELVDLRKGTFQDFTGHWSTVSHVCFSPRGDLLLSASGSELLLWKVV